MGEVSTGAVFSVAKSLAPPQEVTARAGRIDAKVFELGGTEGEEGVPVWKLGRMSGETTAN